MRQRLLVCMYASARVHVRECAFMCVRETFACIYVYASVCMFMISNARIHLYKHFFTNIFLQFFFVYGRSYRLRRQTTSDGEEEIDKPRHTNSDVDTGYLVSVAQTSSITSFHGNALSQPSRSNWKIASTWNIIANSSTTHPEAVGVRGDPAVEFEGHTDDADCLESEGAEGNCGRWLPVHLELEVGCVCAHACC